MRRAAVLLVLSAIACHKTEDSPAPEVVDAGDDAPSWLGDAGQKTRAPTDRPLANICGIAAPPGDLPLGDDDASRGLRKDYFDAAKDLGGLAIRRDFLWQDIEPEKGKLVFDGYDRLVAEANAAGVPLLGMLAYGTSWANASSKGDPYFPPDRNEDYAAFAKATAARYAGKVAAWEIWNEPNNGFRFWKTNLFGEPARYADLLAAAHAAIHEVSPDTPVLLGGTVFTPQLIHGGVDWLSEAYASRPELEKSFEVAGIHTYASYPPERPPEVGEDQDPPLEAKIAMHAWLLGEHGGDDKPIWITEIGWPVYGKVDEAAQARFTVRATILAAYAGVSGIYFYTLRDGPNPNKFPPEDAFGLRTYDSKPKPVYVALKALLAKLGDAVPTTRDPRISGLPADGRAIVFHGAHDTVVAWTVTSTATVQLVGRGASLFDQAGNAKGTVAAGGSFTIGPDVTYVVE